MCRLVCAFVVPTSPRQVYLDKWNSACSKFIYDPFQNANNKGADQSGRICRLVCAFVVPTSPRPIWLKPDLLLLCPPVDLTLTRERSSSLTSVFQIVLFLSQPIAARISYTLRDAIHTANIGGWRSAKKLNVKKKATIIIYLWWYCCKKNCTAISLPF